MTNDAELLRRYAVEKSEPAFTELVQRHVNFVYACALRRVRNPQLAEDVTQQVFVAAARGSASLMKREVLGGWLYTTARNVSVQIVRGEQRRQTRETEAQIMHELTLDPPHDAAWQRLNPVLDEGMDQLSEADRDAVLLRFYEGKSFLEIGARLRLSENAARMRVDRALERMRGVLERQGVTSTTAALGLALASQTGVAAPASLAATITGAVLALGPAAGSTAGIFALFTHLGISKILAGAAVIVVAAGMIIATSLSLKALAVRESFRASSAAAETASQPAGDLELKSGGVVAAGPTPVQPTAANSPGGPASASGIAKIVTNPAAARQARRDAKTEANRAAKQEAAQTNRTTKLRESTIRRLTPLFEQLSLTPGQKDKLVVLVMNQHESTIDLAAANARQGIDISDDLDVYRAGKTQMREEFEAEVRALLGESGYQAFLANDFRVAQEAVVEHLQIRLTPGTQLSEAQTNQLLTLLRERDTWIVDDEVLQRANVFLSAPQMDFLKLESMRQREGPLKPAVQKVIDRNFSGERTPAEK